MSVSVLGGARVGEFGADTLIGRLKSLLEPGIVLEALRNEWLYPIQNGLEVENCRLVRVAPRDDEGFVLEYDLELGNRSGRVSPSRLFVEVGAADPRQRFEELLVSLKKPRRRQLSSKSPVGAVDYLNGLGLVVRLPGFDERLPGLKLLHRPRLLRPTLVSEVLDAGETAGKVRARILGQRLGKRCTVRFVFKVSGGDSPGRVRKSVIGKFYKMRSEVADRSADALLRLRANGFDEFSSVRVPALIRFSRNWQTQIMEDVPGRALGELSGNDYRSGAGLAGEALGRLHSCPVEVPGWHSVDDELAVVARWVGLAREVHADLAAAVDGAQRRVAAELEACRGTPRRLVHRDYSDHQVLIDGSRVTMIDFDTLCHADPAVDVGNFLACLELERARGSRRTEGAGEAFLAGYGADRAEGMRSRIEAYSRSALLRLACMASFETPGGVAETLLERIAVSLGGGT